MHLTKTAIVVIDLETTGLEDMEDRMLEIGMVAFDKDLNAISTFSRQLSSPAIRFRIHEIEAAARDGNEQAKLVVAMHNENGLFAECESDKAVDLDVAAKDAISWLGQLDGVGLPMAGSNVANFDRKFLKRYMPSLEKMFHYRNIDTSSIKEWLRTFSPELYEEAQQGLDPKKLHRTVADCFDTRDELRAYNEVLL